jgi:hypothetical protein
VHSTFRARIRQRQHHLPGGLGAVAGR